MLTHFMLGLDLKSEVDDKYELLDFFEQEKYTREAHGVSYENKNTNVSFELCLGDEYDFEFHIGCLRPHYFALEAAMELSKFNRAFPFTVYDAQDYSDSPKFIKKDLIYSWILHNANCISEATDYHLPEKFLRVPKQKIDQYWNWNFNIDDFQDQISKKFGVYVAPLKWVLHHGKAEPLSFWTNFYATVLQRNTDIIIADSGNLMYFVSYQKIASLLENNSHSRTKHKHVILNTNEFQNDENKALILKEAEPFDPENIRAINNYFLINANQPKLI